ncbi:MAG TPA: universal stress protein [Polyangiales bacterium]|nr:universal stress protein [Polyangiales bacterium]
MNRPHPAPASIVDTVLHPTDFSEASRVAFHHALRISLLANASLTLLHAAPPDADAEWFDFPAVRETLERWRILPENSPRSAVPQLGIAVQKVLARQSDPVKAVLHYLGEHPADLIVLATHRHEAELRWLHQAVAEPLARQAGQMTLFIPENNAGFVSAMDGTVSLQNIVIPIADAPHAQPAVEAAARLVRGSQCRHGSFTLLHVGEADAMPQVQCPELAGWEWKRVRRTGAVIAAILETVSQTNADLIAMTTDGRNGFLDALRGSHSERLLRNGFAPLLTVPVGSLAEDYLR